VSLPWAKKRRDAAQRDERNGCWCGGKMMPRKGGLVELHRIVDAIFLLWEYSNPGYHLLQLDVPAHMSTEYKLE
jgi:hypothetical protein